MKTKKKKILTFFGIALALFLAGVTGYQIGVKEDKKGYYYTSYLKDLSVFPENFMSDFAEINNIVKKNYSFLESKHILIDSLFKTYSQKIEAISNREDYGKILLEYFAELKNGHSNLFYSVYYTNAKAKWVDGRIFIDQIDIPLLENGIEEKDEILEIDHIPVLEWVRQQEKYIGTSTDFYRTYMSVENFIFRSAFDKVRTFLIKTKQGNKEVTLQMFDSQKTVESSVLQDSIGYIAINSMFGNVYFQFKEEFEKHQAKPILIIDIRANEGGSVDYSELIAEYLITKKQKACDSKKNLFPRDNHYKGKLYLLIGPKTFSAAESFALNLRENGSAVLIGSPTGGDTGNEPKIFTTKRHTSFRIPVRKPVDISPKGFPMEGTSISPDYTVYQTVEDYLRGKDTVLEYAINEIIRKK
jgi:carboxyl-terminal processing protease